MPFASTAFPGSLGAELSASDSAWSKQYGFSAIAQIGGDGNWLISSSNTTYAVYQHSAAPANANYRVGASFAHIGGALAYELGVIGRAAAGADTFYHLTYQRSSGKTRIFSRVASAQNQVGGDYTGFVLTTTPAVFELVMDGNQISARIDGVTVIGPVTDNAISAAGRAGVLAFNSREVSVNDRAKIDDWYAEDIVAVSDLAGNVTLDAAVAAGTMGSSASDLSGGVTLDAVGVGGSMGLQPGTCVVPALRNWGGSLALAEVVPWVTFCRLTDAQQVLILANQVTHGTTADLSVTNAALVIGTWYMAMGWNADGSKRFAVPVQAA